MRAEQIPYGVKDFKRIRLEGLYYVDKNAFIRKMEERALWMDFCSNLIDRLRVRLSVAEKGEI